MQISPILIAITAAPLLAQTTPPRSTTAHPATAAHRAVTESATCAKLPEISPKIPALAAGTSCPKPLFTITRTPEIHADYISPLVGPDIREVLAPPPLVISLVYADEKAGTGPLVQHHKYTEIRYTGYLTDGTVFDSNMDAPKPLGFTLSGHQMIPGMDMGLEGMHVGGKRRLYIPYTLAYGEQGRPPKIPPRSMLVFDVELVAQSDAPPPAPPAPARPETAPGSPSGAAAPAGAPEPKSPAGAAGSPPVNSTTPSTSTQPAQPSSTSEPKK